MYCYFLLIICLVVQKTFGVSNKMVRPSLRQACKPILVDVAIMNMHLHKKFIFACFLKALLDQGFKNA